MRCPTASWISFVCVLLPFGIQAQDRISADSVRVEVVIGGQTTAGVNDNLDSPLRSPFGIDFSSRGDMVIVELEGGRVHRLDRQGELILLAGDGSKTYRGDGGPARNATFNGMHNVAVTPNNDIYISDSWNHCIRRIDAKTGVISTVAGTGQEGYKGEGGPATKAHFNFIMCISLGPKNNELYIADLKNLRIRALDLHTGLVRLIAGNGKKGIPRDGELASESPLIDPRAVAVDSNGQVYILERGGHALRMVDASGRIHTVAGTGQKGFKDGAARGAQLNSPKHICVDDHDNVYIADDQNRAIRRYDPRQRTLTTVLGRGFGDSSIELSRPHGVCVEKGRLYVVDTGNDRILRLN